MSDQRKTNKFHIYRGYDVKWCIKSVEGRYANGANLSLERTEKQTWRKSAARLIIISL